MVNLHWMMTDIVVVIFVLLKCVCVGGTILSE